jgi:hypothetical protein
VLDILILETADHVDDGVHLADVGQELVAQPSPWLAPLTSPAMSTNSTVAGTLRSGLTMAASASSLGSGTWTTPVLGSMVAKG